jgi:hypothetical protein
LTATDLVDRESIGSRAIVFAFAHQTNDSAFLLTCGGLPNSFFIIDFGFVRSVAVVRKHPGVGKVRS